MDINITEDKNNSLFNRREVNFNVTFEGPTPSRKDVKLKMAAMLNCSPQLVIVQSLDNLFGKEEVIGYAKIYESEDRMKEIEKEYVLKRNELPEEEPEEETPEEEEDAAEEAAEEASEE
ncbi:small subunit ribosomal protein S24e [Methanohalophilus levihalophilus]|uniref:30S ribosomal protein S24e n=1 Tax=Methanohalophilus levihalophilus TaxID=1431282 RepID=UPI001AE397FE|nr:30S ribosomal protein S24e [Methanohalophilus levihalophilus]MBP2030441.1 small subunit ribosomal protein S24e [Methanohalophilus levihalophilus]